MPALKHLIFDLHGVLADGRKLVKFYDAEFVRVLGRVGIDSERAIKYHRQLLDWWQKQALEIYKSRSERVLEEMSNLDDRYEQAMLSIIAKHTEKPLNEYYLDIESRGFEFRASSQGNGSFPDVKPALENIRHSYPNLLLHVASNAHSSHVRGTLVGAHLTTYFSCILGYDHIGFHKTNSQYWSRLLQAINGNSAETVFVGNSQEEIEGCKKVGITCIIIERDEVPDHSISGNYLTIKNLSEVLPVLNNLESI
ncbi:MAG: HAD family hydrolase [Candidatus Hodarchaeota archaeon]